MFQSVARIIPNMMKLSVDPNGAVKHAVACLTGGKAIAVPTDTVYGLAVSAQNETALNQLYQIKARDTEKPLAICVPSVEEIGIWANISHLPYGVLNALLPGPVTVVLQRGKNLNPSLNPGNPKVGIRVPDNAFITQVAKEFGGPIALTSANVSTEPSSLKTEEFSSLWPMLAAVFDGGTLPGSRKASTVVDLSRLGYYQVLRHGSAYDTTVSALNEFKLSPLKQQ